MNQNIICWFEIYVSDIQRAKKFYHDVLGTQFNDAPEVPGDAEGAMKMSFFSSPENQGVSGALIEMPGANEEGHRSVGTMVYFPCNDCSTEEARVKGAGGQVHKNKFSLNEYGFCSICVDTEGNVFGLYSMQ